MKTETKITDGGPAFPVRIENATGSPMDGFDGSEVPPMTEAQYKGLSVRDYFAAKAMQGMLAHGEHVEGGWKRLVDAAYSYADAMLRAREGR